MKNNLIRFLKIVFKKNKVNATIAFSLMLITSGLSLFMPQITKMILDNAIKNNNINLLLKLTTMYIGITLISNILSLVLDYIYSKMKNRVSLTFKIKLVRHLAKLSGDYYTNIKSGNILNILESDMHIVESLGAELLFSLIVDFFMAVIALAFLIKMQADLLIIVICIQITILLSQYKFTKLIESKNDEIIEKSGEIANINQEYISNLMNIVISKANLKFFKKYLKKERSIFRANVQLDMVFSVSMAGGRILSAFITVAIYGYGGYKIINGAMTFGDLIAFQQYTEMLISPCMNIIRSNIQIQQSKTSVNRIFTVLDEPIKIPNNNCGIRCTKEFLGDIDFNQVNFSYEDTSSILNNINLELKNGKVTALVGSSGCGKSTISKLLFRLWDVENGNINIDGVSIKDYNLKDIRKNISIITQDSLLFDDTIINNLVFDKKHMDEKQIYNICKCVGIYDFINELPNGFETTVGEKGVKLSGGQKQRIAIARALLTDSKIIVFDEATSALDNISQSIILENINKYLTDKTVLVIAHRLSTVKNADKIYVIDKGIVVESGSHEELVSNKSVYYNLLNEKNRKEVFT
ncbi:ABC transporter family protein [[Clostridium] bifermentans ATCC 638]|uniref:ABC transporter family protein n=1 Tax=Paraclostridium bifermentans ATCC 638 = DSM 14991 TaxID=1233171 RepID=T4VP82_PARBF|nr:ABC transporter ATP-binding protein [Paraclostridium bifermentans]EQK45509.1 ABC transporter family protein [[Clostridium] bifermentans ATCC 638] [Paraclostridium bifermentans ATCC 638 = DSM 14991]RIZ57556.1 ABC transporter ATP-binding protein [Paraclostridium bifermentans]UAG18028.1 ABC transporter ATP-binding protein/permease [Paraclostridium bifermentans]